MHTNVSSLGPHRGLPLRAPHTQPPQMSAQSSPRRGSFMPMSGGASDTYANLWVFYEVPADGAARFAAAGMPMKGGVLGVDHHIKVYHQGRQEN